MKNCFKRVFDVVIVLGLAWGGIFAGGCTKVDDSLGANLIPQDQQMKIQIDTLSNIVTYLGYTDSIPSNQLGTILLGNYSAEGFGVTTCGAVAQYMPGLPFNDGANNFGYNPVADSAKIVLYVSSILGDGTVEQTFNVYGIRKEAEIPYDSVYYPNFDVAQVADMSTPLFTFKLKTAVTGSVTEALIPTEAGKTLMQELAEADSVYYSTSDTLFHNDYNGFYIAPAPDSPKDAAIYRVTLYESDYTTVNASYFRLYAHNYKENTEPYPQNVDTTVYADFGFDDYTGYTEAEPNTSINVIRHDYSGTAIPTDRFNDTTQTVSVGYVQGLCGVYTGVRFTDEFMAQLAALNEFDRTKYRSVMINQARLFLPLQDPDNVDALDLAPTRLGMYQNYRGSLPIPISDYQYTYESSYTVPYGGYLNRSHSYYEMDITSQVSQLVTSIQEGNLNATQRLVWVAPIWNSDYSTPLFSTGEVAIDGSNSDNPIRVQVTYTLIK